MTVAQMYALLLLGLVVLGGGLVGVVALAMKLLGPMKYLEGFNTAKALLSADVARVENENKNLRRRLYSLEGNTTRVYQLGDGQGRMQ